MKTEKKAKEAYGKLRNNFRHGLWSFHSTSCTWLVTAKAMGVLDLRDLRCVNVSAGVIAIQCTMLSEEA
jgi:hypothetical protein